MPVDPYVPSSYRSDRVVLFADGDNEIQRVDETILTQDGVTITAYWKSPTLNAEDLQHEYTLTKLDIFYSANAATTITLTASGDGGVTWTAILGDTATTTILQSNGAILNVVAGFNVTGYDLRFRIQYTTDVAVKVLGYAPVLVQRGRVDVAR